jgi:hypothetical protein
MSVNDYDAEHFDAIEDLIAEGELEEGSAAHGVARQVTDSGYDSLTPKQRTLYDKVVMPALLRRDERLRIIHITNSADP